MPRSNKSNPSHIAALIIVDVSPRWLYGFSVVEPEANVDQESIRLPAIVAQVAERIGSLVRHIEDLNLPIIAVESGTVDRLKLDGLKGKTVAECGIYGCCCEKYVANWLKARHVRVVCVRDAIAWPPDKGPSGKKATGLFPGVFFPPWVFQETP